MKNLDSSARVGLLLASLVGLLIATEAAALAQRSPNSIQRRVDQLNRQGEQFERDHPERTAKDGDKNDRGRSQALLAQIRKDLEALQAGYNEIVLAMAASKMAEDARILPAVVSINECSTRLKHNLALPQPKDDKPEASVTTAMPQPDEPPLMTLRKHIYKFVMNPLFESPAVLDVEQAKNASRDLDKIIELSDSISKHAKKKSAH